MILFGSENSGGWVIKDNIPYINTKLIQRLGSTMSHYHYEALYFLVNLFENIQNTKTEEEVYVMVEVVGMRPSTPRLV